MHTMQVALLAALPLCIAAGLYAPMKTCHSHSWLSTAHVAPNNANYTICAAQEPCYILTAGGREACVYYCHPSDKSLRRGYRCNQRPPPAEDKHAALVTGPDGGSIAPFVNVTAAPGVRWKVDDVVGDSLVPRAILFDGSLVSASVSTPSHAVMALTSAEHTQVINFFHRSSATMNVMGKVQILDGNDVPIVEFLFAKNDTSLPRPCPGLSAVLNGVCLNETMPNKFYGVEFEIDVTNKTLRNVKMFHSAYSTSPSQESDFLIWDSNGNATSARQIPRGHAIPLLHQSTTDGIAKKVKIVSLRYPSVLYFGAVKSYSSPIPPFIESLPQYKYS